MPALRRRHFITLLGGAVTWPLAARTQQAELVRRIGVLVPAVADDPVWQARVGAFLQGLALLGWTIGRNVHIDTRWGTPNAAELRRQAAELGGRSAVTCTSTPAGARPMPPNFADRRPNWVDDRP